MEVILDLAENAFFSICAQLEQMTNLSAHFDTKYILEVNKREEPLQYTENTYAIVWQKEIRAHDTTVISITFQKSRINAPGCRIKP